MTRTPSFFQPSCGGAGTSVMLCFECSVRFWAHHLRELYRRHRLVTCSTTGTAGRWRARSSRSRLKTGTLQGTHKPLGIAYCKPPSLKVRHPPNVKTLRAAPLLLRLGKTARQRPRLWSPESLLACTKRCLGSASVRPVVCIGRPGLHGHIVGLVGSEIEQMDQAASRTRSLRCPIGIDSALSWAEAQETVWHDGVWA